MQQNVILNTDSWAKLICLQVRTGAVSASVGQNGRDMNLKTVSILSGLQCQATEVATSELSIILAFVPFHSCVKVSTCHTLT